ncbi:MAG: adenylosuccinate synthase [Deltaproteobacteria bacterium]|nr:adenylosuccinate synthase [Deltaproteobacteria bacterium]
MANVVIVGMQWGDEGKGKIVDLICPAFDGVARYQGGHNAGHTVRFGDSHFSLHLIPSGVLHDGKLCVLGNGMVINPDAFFKELKKLHGEGVDTEGRLFVSNRAHLILPAAAALDQAREAARGDRKIGTTARGIGPAYEGKISRFGLRLCDLSSPDLEIRLRDYLARADREITSLSGDSAVERPNRIMDLCERWRESLEPFLRDTELLLHEHLRSGKSLLLEGAQGTLLDVDHGTFPFVTSSNSTTGGACTGTGIPPTAISGAIGVLKAYTTRVGEGPFTTELEGEAEEFLRTRGNEFGTTTGRPRRCGWLDLVAVRYAQRVNGIEAVALTKMDVLDELEEIQVCVGYRQGGIVHKEYSARFETGEGFEPVYRRLPGWRQSTVGIRDFASLPAAARAYVEMIEGEIGAEIPLVSTGPRREETILRGDGILGKWLGAGIQQIQAQS